MTKFFSDIKRYRDYMVYSARSELKAEVANSYLNWIWWILEPLCFMAIYAFIFTFVFKGKIQHMTAFIFIGITMWDFFSRMLKNSVRLVRNKRSILSKIYVPKYVLILEKMAINAFKMAISLVIVVLLMIITKVTPTVQILWVFPILLSFAILTFGLSTWLLHFGVYVDDLMNVTDIGLRLLFYVTGVFYNLEGRIKGTPKHILLHFNPMAFYINAMRNALLYGKMPSMKWLISWTIVGILVSVSGIILIQKNENNYVKVI